MSVTVTTKGRVTIPKRIRDWLGVGPGNTVEFELAADGRVTLTKLDAAQTKSRFEALRGRAGTGLSTDEVMALTRGGQPGLISPSDQN